jgi:hypothetical protein
MRVSKFVVTLLSLTALAFVVPRLEAQVHPMTKMFECYTCLVFTPSWSMCIAATEGGPTGRETCNDASGTCQMGGMACAILPPIIVQMQKNETAPSVPGMKGGELRLAAIGPYLWAGGDCENGLHIYRSTSPDLAVGLVEVTAQPMELALR